MSIYPLQSSHEGGFGKPRNYINQELGGWGKGYWKFLVKP